MPSCSWQIVIHNLIFISNADQRQDYALCRQLQHSSLSQVPKVLLVNARDDVNESLLEQFGLQGMIRKPFEAATLRHISAICPVWNCRANQWILQKKSMSLMMKCLV